MKHPSAVQEKEIIQFEFWNECKESRCKFCSLDYTADGDQTLNPNIVLSPVEKKFILDQIINHIPLLDWSVFDQISFQGGEIMNEKDEGFLSSYDTLLNIIISLIYEGKVKKLYLITGLKFAFEGSLLEYTLSKFAKEGLQDNLMIGTSYDIKYRFTAENERNWWSNLGKIKRAGFRIHCTSILSQFFIDAYKAKDKRLMRIFKIFPNRLYDLIGCIGDRFNEKLPKDFLPKRKDFFAFCFTLMRDNFDLWKRFADQSGRRATHVFRPLHNITIWRDIKNHSCDNPMLHAECGHYIYCRSYSDSGECYACDINNMLSMEQGDI